MFLFAIALAAATPAPPVEVQRVRRTRVTRARLPARAKPSRVAIPVVAVPRDPDARFRLTDLPDETPNGKLLAVRNTGMACGINGAPVCPSKGTPVLRAPLESDE